MTCTVLHLRVVDNRSQDTIQVLRALLARAERGEVVGVALSYRPRKGKEQAVFTGAYRDRPGDAALASMRMSMMVNDLEDTSTP